MCEKGTFLQIRSQISSDSKIVCHLAEFDGCQKFIKNADFIHLQQLLLARCASLLLKSLLDP